MTKTHDDVLQRSLDALDVALAETTKEELKEYVPMNNEYTVDVVITLTLKAPSHRDAEREAEEFTQTALNRMAYDYDTDVTEAEFALSTVTLKEQG